MLNKKLQSAGATKLAKTLSQISQGEETEKTGFLMKSNKSGLLKTKSFRLRESDLLNLTIIKNEINRHDNRMSYSESQILRGLINYIAENLEVNIKKISPYVRSSS